MGIHLHYGRYHQLIFMSSVPITYELRESWNFIWLFRSRRSSHIKSIYSFFNLLSYYISSIFPLVRYNRFFLYQLYFYISLSLFYPRVLSVRNYWLLRKISPSSFHDEAYLHFNLNLNLNFFLLKKMIYVWYWCVHVAIWIISAELND